MQRSAAEAANIERPGLLVDDECTQRPSGELSKDSLLGPSLRRRTWVSH
jgi:hypothetical protein